MHRFASVAVLALASTTFAQGPKATPEHKFLQGQAGKWDAVITLPGANAPMKGSLEVRKLGNTWVTSTLKMDFGPLKYEGRGTMGFDPRKKKFVGSWADNITDSLALPEGTLDEATKTFTETWSQALPNGDTAFFKLVTTHDGDDKMKAVYHSGKTADELKEVMTIEYTRAKTEEKKAK